MGGDEAKLVAAGKEAKEDQDVTWVAEGTDQDYADRFCQFRL